MDTEPSLRFLHGFSSAAADQLGRALERYVQRWQDVQHPQLRDALGRLANEAHAAGMGPEKMISAVKRFWLTVPSVLREDEYLMRIALSGLVDLCIEAYYQVRAGPAQ